MKRTMRPPISGTEDSTSHRSRPSPKTHTAPGLSLRPGLTSASQSVALMRLSSSTSTGTLWPWLSTPSFTPSRRAGITFVSLMTSASPAFR